MCHYVLQASGGDKDSGQMIVPVENRTFLSGLKQREVGSLRNLSWLCIPRMLARGRQPCQV